MDLICPLCNGLYYYAEICPYCHSIMIDKGALVNYFDDYSPYLLDEISHFTDGVSKDKCIHVFYCKNCNIEKNVSIERVIF